jgi:hypothetical protein
MRAVRKARVFSARNSFETALQWKEIGSSNLNEQHFTAPPGASQSRGWW